MEKARRQPASWRNGMRAEAGEGGIPPRPRASGRGALLPGITLPALLALPLLALSLVAGPSVAWAQAADEEIRLGYLLSRAGGFNTHDRAGGSMGEDELNQQAEVVGKRFRILYAHGGKSTEVVEQAKRLVEQEGVKALLGSVSPAATVALAEYAQQRGIVFFNVGSDADSLRGENCARNTFSIGPSLTMRVRALGQWAIQGKEWKTWAIVEGDSKGESRLSEAARTYLQANGGAVAGVVKLSQSEAHEPVQVLNTLRGMKADFVYVAVTGEKQELFLDAYQKAGILTPIGGAEPELQRMSRDTARFAGYWATGWSHQSDIFGASELNNRFADWAGIPMNERSWGAWAGVKILGEAILRAGSPQADQLVPYLREQVQFDGYMGATMNFRPWNQQLRQKIEILRVSHDARWNGWDALVQEASVPARGLKGWQGNPLDSIDVTAAESGCKY